MAVWRLAMAVDGSSPQQELKDLGDVLFDVVGLKVWNDWERVAPDMRQRESELASEVDAAGDAAGAASREKLARLSICSKEPSIKCDL